MTATSQSLPLKAVDGDGNVNNKLDRTRFPKIDGKIKGFLKEVQCSVPYDRRLETAELEGTVKLHGSHADILFDISPADLRHVERLEDSGEISGAGEVDSKAVRFQSRNVQLSLDQSLHGFPRHFAKKLATLQQLKFRILQKYRLRNPFSPVIDKAQPLIVAGEWIGGAVQKDIALEAMPTSFVILSIQLNGVWQSDSDYGDIEFPAAGIYNVRRAGVFKVPFDLRDLTPTNRAFQTMMEQADEVGPECPFAAIFGVQKGKGEGIVWKFIASELRANSKLWLKTKSERFEPRRQMPATKNDGAMDPKTKAKTLATLFVTPRRVEQGLEYLKELGLDVARENIKTFMNWVTEDVMTEESIQIEESQVPEKVQRSSIVSIAATAYLTEVARAQHRSTSSSDAGVELEIGNR